MQPRSFNPELARFASTKYDLLKILVTHAGKVITHRQLLRQVWGEGPERVRSKFV
jgi:two-component system, OmpR family, KDP operon response regulator KdpE